MSRSALAIVTHTPLRLPFRNFKRSRCSLEIHDVYIDIRGYFQFVSKNGVVNSFYQCNLRYESARSAEREEVDLDPLSLEISL